MNYKCEIESPDCLGKASKVVRGTHYCDPCKLWVMNDLMNKLEERSKKREEFINGNTEGSDVRQVPEADQQPNQ